MAKIETVEQYISLHSRWEKELNILRKFLKSFPFEETIKWGGPVYTYQGKNIVGIAGFKNHYALWFFQGGNLQKNTDLLHNAQEGKTKTLRQIRFTEETEINTSLLKPYIEEAMVFTGQDKPVKPKKVQKVIISPEFLEVFKNDPKIESAFAELSPGKQREFISYITEAKREETKKNRLEKILPLIRQGKGLNDKYKNS